MFLFANVAEKKSIHQRLLPHMGSISEDLMNMLMLNWYLLDAIVNSLLMNGLLLPTVFDSSEPGVLPWIFKRNLKPFVMLSGLA